MGANNKLQATYHGVSHNPDTDLVRTVYAGASPVPSYEDRETAFDRWLETVRAEAKAEAWDEGWCVGWGNAWDSTKLTGTDLVMSDNPYKEDQK